MNTLSKLIIGAIVGAASTVAIYSVWLQPNSVAPTVNTEPVPKYWVAPMDPNYQRDKPGKSPMGMDLIPVYDEPANQTDEGPGTIKISPEVVNNLGVRTVKVQQKALRSAIKTVGYVGYDEDQMVHIHPRVEGWIEKLYVKAAGNPVEKGQPLYDLYSPALVNAQEELVLALDRKNKRLIQAATDRLKALQLPASALKKLIKTRKVQQFVTLFSPKSGVVDNLNIREGFFVKPGTSLMSVGTLEQVWVEAEVFERQVFQVSEGQLVTMSLDFLPGRQWQGKVDYVYPTLDSQTRTVKIRLRFDNYNKALKPNMFAQVVIHAKSDSDTLVVPKESIIRTGNIDRVVLALGEGRFKSVAVSIGRSDPDYFEVIGGLAEGEKIVSSAQFLLDSESSKTSDFKRMSDRGTETEAATSVWVWATINHIMPGRRVINVSHDAIGEWDRPAMTMELDVGDNIDFNQLPQMQRLRIKIEVFNDHHYRVIDIEIPDGTTTVDTRHKGHRL